MPADEDRGMPRMGESSPLQLPECTLPSRRRNGSLLPSAQLEERTSHHTDSTALNTAGWARSLLFGRIIFFNAEICLCMFWLQIPLAQLISLMSKSLRWAVSLNDMRYPRDPRRGFWVFFWGGGLLGVGFMFCET